MLRATLILAVCGILGAETIDKLAIAVGKQTITQLQLDEEIRVTAFLNDKPVKRTNEERRAAADRLIEQMLVKREMKLSRYPLPDAAEVQTYYDRIREARGSAQSFEELLGAYQLTAAILREHLALQLTLLRFVEFRFRPDVGVSETDIQSYYQEHLAEWRESHPGQVAPSFAASRESLKRAVIEARTNQVLDTWIEESRKQVNIVYLDPSLR